jgi:hypothetical protein
MCVLHEMAEATRTSDLVNAARRALELYDDLYSHSSDPGEDEVFEELRRSLHAIPLRS